MSVGGEQGRALSPMQRAFWATQRRRPDDPVFNMALVTDLGTGVDLDAWAHGFEVVVERSSVLRDVVTSTSSGPRWTTSATRRPTEVVVVPRSEVDDWAAARIANPLDASVSTYDSVLLDHGDGSASWYLNVHHVSVDGSSFIATYEATRAVALGLDSSPGDEFHDWIAEQHERSGRPGRRADAARAHWASVEWPAPVARLYGGRAVPDGPSAATRHLVSGGSELVLPETLGGINETMRWTTGLATVAAAWVAAVADVDEVTLGIPVHHRRTAAARAVIGPLVEIAPVAIRVDRTRSMVELHDDVAAAVMASLTHAQPGLTPARTVDVLVNVVPDRLFQPWDDDADPVAPVWVHNGHLEPTLLGQLQLTPYEGGELIVDVNGSVAPPAPERASDHVKALLTALVDGDATPLSQLELGGAADRAALGAWSDGGPSDAPMLLDALQRAFTEGTERGFPDVEEQSGRRVGGPTMWNAAERLARRLVQGGVRPGDRVATDIVRSIEAVVAPLGIWLAGASWVPLEPSHPASRRADLRRRSGAVELLDRDVVAGCVAAAIDASSTQSADDVGHPLPGLGDLDEAYLLFTSGSTGQPKGVPITHRGVSVYSANALSHLNVEHIDDDVDLVVPLFSTMSFDLTVTPLLVPLLAGGRLVTIEEDGRDGLLAVAGRRDLTYVRGTPSHLDLLCRFDPASAVRRVVACGERFTVELARRVRAAFGDDVVIVNEYGPTESVVACAEHVVPGRAPLPADGDLPIGRPHPGTTLRIVSPAMDLHENGAGVPVDVPVGAVGELWIASEGLTAGYLDAADDVGRFVEDDGRRWYRTGDLARLGDDDTCWCLGRIDDQMKVGGVRVEPAEIEAAIASHEAVSAAVARLVQVDGRSTLVAWIVPVGGGAVDTADVRRHAGTILHRAVVPSHVVAVEALPTTPNGKVDTAALRERFASAMATAPAADSVDAEQPSPVEEAVADDVAAVLVAMRDLLGRDVGADDDFFESGGDSLAGLDLAAALRATGYRLEDAVVFEELTARRIADRMEAVAAEAFVARPAHVPPPLTPGEAALLFEHQNDPDDPRYQVGRRVLVGTAGTPAEVDVDRLAMAFQSVVSRHPSFTWTYASPRVRRRPDRLVEFDLPSAASAAVDVDTFDALLATVQRRPLDPTRDDAPLRLLIRRLVDGRLAVGLAAHHVSLDATTFDVLWEQIDDEYSGRPGPDLSGPDLADLLAATVDPDDPLVAARLERWLDRVDRPTAELDLGRPVRAADGVVSRPLGVAIDQLSIRDATPFATLLAAFACALRRRADGDGIGVGIVATVREHAAMRYQLGYHMNTLPVVVDTATPRLGDVVDAAGRLSTDALIDRATPLSSIVAALRSGGGPRGQATQPTINAMIAFERYAAGALGDLPVHSTATWAGSAVTDVTLFCHVQGDEAILQIEYSGDVLDEGGARVLLDDVAHLAHLATTGDEVDHHDVALPSSMPALPAPEAVEPPPALGTLIRAAAGAAEPDAPAVVADRIMSWAELDETSAKVAGWLDEQVSTPAVGVVTTRTATTVAALLGVQRAGCAYVPLDPSYPESHLAHVLADTGADLVLVDGAFDDVSSRLPGDVRVVSLDEVASSAAAPSDAWPTDPSAPAYVIHTSGSTGLPKGVPVNQGNIGHSTDSRADAYPSSPAAFLMVSPMGFDSSMVGLWWPLATGGTVVLPDDHRRDDPDHLLGLIASERITHTLMLPSLWEILLDAARPGDPALAGLETVIVAGEACSPDLVAKHQALLPRCLLANEYGPTETTVWSHRHLFDTASAASESPIGEVLPGGVSMVADDALRPRPADVPGELLIAGPGVTDGYLDRSDETAARFVELNGRRWYRTGDLVTVDVDGVHRFHGRLDDQVKIRGHRIELDAVDAAGQRLDGVDAAAAAVVELPDGRSVLVLHVVPSDGVTVDAASEEGWRARLTEELPAAAVPSRFVPTSALPTRPNGKVDRRALVAATPTSPAPSTTRRTAGGADEGLHPHASRLLTAWTEVLGVDGIGVDDDFFDLGGDSIVAIRIAAALRPHGVTFTPRSIFEHSTVRTLAPLLTPIEAGQDGPVTGEVPLLPAQRWFEALAPRDVVRWTQHLELDLARPVEGELLERFGRALDRLVDHHEALRMRFELSEGRLRQLAGPRTRRVPVASASNSAEAVERLGELLDLNEGVLLGAVVIEDRPGWVLLGAHHLVVDAVSFGLLVDDLDALLAGASALPSRGTSVAGWADHLVSLDQPDLPASWSVPDLTGTEGSTAARTVDVDVPTTAALAALGRPIDEVVAAAIAAAAPAAAPSLLHAGCLDVTLERHGREGVAPIDLSRTVGWFTTTDRMCVDGLVPDVAVSSVFDTVARLGDQQRASLLTDARRAMAGQLAANDVVRVNHLGAVTGRRLDTIRSVGPLIGTIAATNTRGQQLGVLVRDVAGGLAITVDHSAADLSAPEFEALVDALPAVLSELAEQGEGHGQQSSGGDTGRFDLAGLDQAGFDALEAALASLD